MIGNVAIDSRALRVAPTSPDMRAQKRLAATILEYGRVGLTGAKDRQELIAAMRTQAQSIGIDFWGPLVRAMESQGVGVFEAEPPQPASTGDYCHVGRYDELSELVQLVVVSDVDSDTASLDGDQAAALHGMDGITRVNQRLELALADAVDQSAMIAKVKELRRESVIPRGTSAGDIWARYFRPLAKASTEVNIFDRYLFSGLAKSEGAPYLTWMLNELNNELPPNATINIYALTGEKLATTSQRANQKAYQIADIAVELQKVGAWAPERPIRVLLADRLDHDRHIRFSSGHAVMSQAGFDRLSLKNGALRDPFGYAYVPPGASLDRRSVVEAAARKSATQWRLQWTGRDWTIGESGTLTWFNPEKGFGFVSPDDGGRDLFLHHSQVQFGHASPQPGQHLFFGTRLGVRGPEAIGAQLGRA